MFLTCTGTLPFFLEFQYKMATKEDTKLTFSLYTYLNVYLFLRGRAQTGEGQREREGYKESEAGSRLQAVSTEPKEGLKFMNCEIMT